MALFSDFTKFLPFFLFSRQTGTGDLNPVHLTGAGYKKERPVGPLLKYSDRK
jgi:hypothetical protein